MKTKIHSCAKLFALFCVFTLCVTHAWAKSYWRVRVVAVDAGGGETAGTVIAGAYGDRNNLQSSSDYATDYTMPSASNEIYTNQRTQISGPAVALYAKEAEGTYFLGWYKDPECTDPYISNSKNFTRRPFTDVTTSEDPDNVPVTTFYALFTTKKIYGRVKFPKDEEKRGVYVVNSTYLYDNEWPEIASSKAVRPEVTSIEVVSFTYMWESNQQPKRGYKFVEWQLEGDYIEILEKQSNYITYTCSAVSDDENNPTTSYIRPLYETLPPLALTVTQLKNGGTTTVSCRNCWLENQTHDGLSQQTIELGTVSGDETEKNFTVYSTDRITLTAAPAENHRFLGWYEGDRRYSTNLAYNFGSISSDRTIEARYQVSFPLYYAGQAETSRGGQVFVSGAPVTESNHGTLGYALDSTARDYVESASATVYFKAVPEDGYTFVGWKKSPAGAYVSYDNTYSETFDATSKEVTSPTTLTMYAYFEKSSAFEAELFDKDGNSQTGSWNEMYNAAQNGNSVVLHKNIDLGSSPLNIQKNITLDFNNHVFTGTGSNLITISNGYTVTFADNSEEAAGGIRLTANAVSEICAVQVNGTLNLVKGVIRCENASTEEGAAATGMTVSATLNLTGGSIEAQSRSNACGIKNNGTATLITGTVNATAESDACGVLANGTTNITWSVAVSATTTTGNNAVGVLIDNAAADVAIDGGVITATAVAENAYGIWAKNASKTVTVGGNMTANATAGTTTTSYAVKEDGVAVNVETGRFASNNTQDIIAATIANLKLHGGYYVHETALDTYKAGSGVEKGELQSGTKFYAEGYRYILSEGDNPNYVVATANGKKFSSLEDAIAYANNNAGTTMTIRLEVPEYTLPAGNYTIPAKATLLIPYKNAQEPQVDKPEQVCAVWTKPSPFSTLTVSANTHIDVFGAIEIGGKQSSEGQGGKPQGAPTEKYGYLVLGNGSQIVLSGNAELRAWGYVTGEGTIDARRGSVVKEMFQLMDYKGGTQTFAYYATNNTYFTRVFPVTQYYIQNIELLTTYHPGSKLVTRALINAWGMAVGFQDIQLVGVYNRQDGGDDDIAMFLMDDADNSEDTWVRKYYDAATDQQAYEINSSARLGSMRLLMELITIDFNSQDFDLPITHNMRIRLLSGGMGISQRTVLLPGAEIIIDKKSTVTIMDEPDKDYDGALFLYDAAEWGKYVYLSDNKAGAYASKVAYSPTFNGTPTIRWSSTDSYYKTDSSLPSASINVKGTLDVKGAIYTSASGANIFSTDKDAGTVYFDAVNAAADDVVYHPDPRFATPQSMEALPNPHIPDVCTSAQLKNGNGGYTQTKNDAVAEDSYCYTNGAWRKLETEYCYVIDKHGSANTSDWEVFAKPQGYVKLVTSEIITYETGTEDEWHEYIGKKDGQGKDTHTYDYVAEWNKKDTFLICMDDCQWWKVVPVEESDTIFHCTHPDNNKYYYWGEEPRTGDEMWLEKKCTVTWNNYDGTKLAEYKVDYKAAPKYLGTNPTRAMNDYYTYDFIGWTPEAETVTRDITYTAQFKATPRKYMITFLDEDGSVLEDALWEVGKVPVCVNQPTPAGKILNWEPTIRAVSGDATYRATYTDEVLPAYTITFVNWDGMELQSGLQETGSLPLYNEAENGTPSKPSIQDKAFVFAGWTPDLAAVTADAVYTARFTEAAAKYTVTFQRKVKDDGSGDPIAEAVTIETQELGYGATPVCITPPVKNPTAAEYYEVVWTPQIASVTGNATYTATGFTAHKNTCRLTVSAGANGKVALDGSEAELSKVYEYGTTATVTATATTEGYRFVRWSDGNTDNPRTVTVKSTTSLKAEFALNHYIITWKDYDGSNLGSLPVAHGAMPAHAVPARANGVNDDTADPNYNKYCCYTFTGWTPAVVRATGNATYTATYTSSPIMFTIRFVLDNGLSDVVRDYNYGDVLTADAPTPVKASKNGVDYRFTGWRNSAGTVYVNAALPAVTNNEIYTAQYETSVTNLVAGNSDAAGAKDLILSDAGMEASTLIIEKDGTVTIPAGASVAVQNFILESDGTKSGQLLGTSSVRLTVAQHAYFDLTLNTQPRTWYAVAVPWEVDAENGIFIKGGRRLVLGRDFDLVYYNGANRATQGPGAHCWQYVEYETDKTMHPGRAYMMYFAPQIATVRFESKDLTIFDDDIQGVEPHAETTGNDGKDANWNGIGNPKVFHARLAAGGATYGYYLNNGKLDEYLQGEGAPTYKLINLASYTAIVGKPLFIQAVNSNSIVATATVAAGAPRRAPEAENYSSVENAYEVTLHASGSAYEDNIFIQTAEQKEPHYVIGQDLVKAGVNAALPQLWVNRYDTRLAVNTTEAVNGTYDYPLTLNIPQTGEYTINSRMSDVDSQSSETLYLTINGSPVWNLSYGAYTATFEKGATTEYGLRIIGSKAPQITTGIGNVQSEDVQCTKVLRDGVIYILRGNNVYSIDGQLVK